MELLDGGTDKVWLSTHGHPLVVVNEDGNFAAVPRVGLVDKCVCKGFLAKE